MGSARRHKHDKKYTQYVRDLAEGGYPNLAQLYNFLHEGDDSRFKSKAGYLDLDFDGQSRARKLQTIDDRKKLKEMAETPLTGAFARIFVIEDLDTDMIEILGASLNLEPVFFADHISDSFGEHSLATGRCPHLPSVSEITSFYTIDYFTAITLDEPNDKRWCCDFNVRRRVDTFHADLHRKSPSSLNRVAFVRRKFSFHVQRDSNPEAWKVVVLADRPIGDPHDLRQLPLRFGPSLVGCAKFKRAEDPHRRRRPCEFEVRSFQGGQLDILPPPKFWDDSPKSKQSKDRRFTKFSPAEDLTHYWLKQAGRECSKSSSSRPKSTCTAPNPYKPSTRATTSTQKGSESCNEQDKCRQRRLLFDISRNALFIAASECMVVLEALHASADARIWDLKDLRLSESAWLQHTANTLEAFQDDALRLKHQLTGQCRSIKRVQEFVKSAAEIAADYQVLTSGITLGTCMILPNCEGNGEGGCCQSCSREKEEKKRNDYGLVEDFNYITDSMECHRQACINMVDTISSLMAVRDSHLSGDLSRLAMFFAPVSIACSVLSLQGNYAPGASLFWVFWIVWPVCLLLVLGISFITLRHIPEFFRRYCRRRSSCLRGSDIDDDYDDPSPGSRHNRVLRELLTLQAGESSIVRNGTGNGKRYEV